MLELVSRTRLLALLRDIGMFFFTERIAQLRALENGIAAPVS